MQALAGANPMTGSGGGGSKIFLSRVTKRAYKVDRPVDQ
jgi:mevalonate kinase